MVLLYMVSNVIKMRDMIRFKKAIPLVILAVLAASSLALFVAKMDGLNERVVASEAFANNLKVIYINKLFGSQSAKISLQGVPKGYHICVSAWGWTPDSSIVSLGKACSASGTIALPVDSIKRYMKAWKNYLIRNKDSLNVVEPGILITVTLVKPGKAIYAVFKAVPINAKYFLEKKASLTITIGSDAIKAALKKPVMTWNEWEKALARSMTARKQAHSTEWPPKLVPIGNGIYWTYYKTIAKNDDMYIPLVIVRLHGYLKYLERTQLLLQEFFASYDKGYVVFTATYHVDQDNAGISIDYGDMGPVFSLKAKTKALMQYLDFESYFAYSDDAKTLRSISGLYNHPQVAVLHVKGSDAIAAIGFRGQSIVAKYCLGYEYPIGGGVSIVTCPKSNTAFATFTMFRPIVYKNHLYYWAEADSNPHDGIGVAEKAFWPIYNTWHYTEKELYEKPLYVSSSNLTAISNAIPLLGVGVPVLPLLIKDPSPLLAPVFAATLGYTSKSVTVLHLSASLYSDKGTNVGFVARIFETPMKLYYDDRAYTISSPVLDIGIYQGGGAPHPCTAPGTSCPTNNKGTEA